MVNPYYLLLGFGLGFACSLMPCCLGIYPGLFAFLQRNSQNPSRGRTFLLSLSFSSGILFVVMLIAWGSVAAASFLRPSSWIISIIAMIVIVSMGILFISGFISKLPVPSIGLPTRLQGLKGAPIYGMIFGGPGATHCTPFTFAPLIFFSLTLLDPLSTALNITFFGIGRIVPIITQGTLMGEGQMKFIKAITGHARLVDMVLGLIMIANGLAILLDVIPMIGMAA